jgi:hypothetical protein
MAATDNYELSRLDLQSRLDSAKTRAERNRLGQFATVTDLAKEIVRCAVSRLPPRSGVRFLDPALGTGAFYSALLRAVPEGRIESAVGYEIDGHYGKESEALWAGTGLRVKIEDFTRATPPGVDGGKANLIVCNPPYVRHHHIGAEEKLRLRGLAERAAGVRLSGLAGLYCYFLCLAHPWMGEGGVAAWLIPSEWMDVNYGDKVKKYLLSRVTLERVHRFDPLEVQFEDALVSSAVVLFRNTPPVGTHHVEFTYGGTLSEPRLSCSVQAEELRREGKWTRYPHASADKGRSDSGPKLSDLFKIQRGLATGANEFFILTEEQATRRGIPQEFLMPILPSPRHLTTDEVAADHDGVPLLDRRLFLLTCDLPEAEVKAKHPTLWAYLREGIESGVNERYLAKHRSPWYSQEKRPPAPLLCTYMGRNLSKRGGAFRFILNHSKATAANVYLMLYPKPALRKELEKNQGLLRSIWEALNSAPAEALTCEGRVYGGGLFKMEPKELGKVSAEELTALLPPTMRGASAPRLF